MPHLDSTPDETRLPDKKLNPIAIYVSFLRERKIKSESERKRQFIKWLMQEENKYLNAAALEAWLSIIDGNAYQEAFPPSFAELKEKAKRQVVERARQQKERAIMYEREKAVAKAQMDELTLDTLICGKPLRDCTGTEIAKLGGRLAKLGKMVGRKKFGNFFATDEAFLKAAK